MTDYETFRDKRLQDPKIKKEYDLLKREEIRGHLIELFEQTDFSKESPEQLADAVLWVEDADGVVIKVDRELPTELTWDEHDERAVHKIQGDMLKAGYVAVERLMEVTCQ